MKHALLAAAALTVAVATAAHAADGEPESPWAFELAAYPTSIRGGDEYTSAILAADHGALHLEARYDYEGVGARSAFLGWTWSGGDAFTWEATPLLGGVWGDFHAVAPGLQVALGWRRFDLGIDAEYVHDTHDRDQSYVYAWSELGFQPCKWLRIGIAGERTRAYGGDREIDRGPFAQWTGGHVTIGATWLNPGASDEVFVGLVGVSY